VAGVFLFTESVEIRLKMKNVIKLFVATAIVGALSVSAFAQGAGPAGQKGGKGTQGAAGKGGPGGGMRRMGDMDGEILAKLNLTDAQKGAIKKLKETMKTKMEALMKSAAPKPGGKAGEKGKGGPAAGGPGGGRMQMSPELRAKFGAIRDDYQAGLKKTLTPKQFTDYEKEVKAMRDKMRQQFGNRGPGAGGPAAGGKGKGKG
jgi:LTXXQ motif family protein